MCVYCVAAFAGRGCEEADEDLDDLDEDEVGDAFASAALSSVCFDPEPRPLFRLRGASALRFTSVRGLQLHILAVLSCFSVGVVCVFVTSAFFLLQSSGVLFLQQADEHHRTAFTASLARARALSLSLESACLGS